MAATFYKNPLTQEKYMVLHKSIAVYYAKNTHKKATHMSMQI